MSEQKPKKPILILSLDTETGGFNSDLNALLTVGIATLKLEDYNDLSKIEKKEWQLCNSFKVVEKTPNDVWVHNPCYVEQEALTVNKLNLYDLETKGKNIVQAELELCNMLDNLNKEYKVHLLGQNLKFDLGFISRNMASFYKKLNNLYIHHELRTLSTAFNMTFHCYDKNKLDMITLYQESTSMDNVRKLLKIESSGQTHSAAVNAEDNIKVFIKLLEKFEMMELV